MTLLIAEDGQSAVLDYVSWATFEALLEDLDGGRVTYDGGSLEIMSPSSEHEGVKGLIGRLIEAYTEELGIDLASRGATTFKRADLEKGLEPDECYYVGPSAALVRGKSKIDLAAGDPAPDLVVEVEISRRAIKRLPIYAALGVSEVWRHDGKALRVESLTTAGTYESSERSLALPDLPLEEVERALARRAADSETDIVRSFRARVREGRSAGG